MTNNKTEKTIEYDWYVIQDKELIKKVQLIEKIEKKYLKNADEEFEKNFYEEMIEDNRKEIKYGILSKKENLTADEKKELEKLDNYLFPKIQVSAKLYPETHKQLKIRATTEDTTIDKMATSIIEDRIHDLDIAKYVEKEFENINDSRQSVHLGSDHWNKMEEKFRDEYEEVYEYLAEKGKSIAMKRINVKVYLSTHKKLGVIGAIENKSLGTLVSEYLEKEFGFIDVQDQNEKIDGMAREILLKELEKAVGAEKVSEITEIIPDINSTVLVRTLKSLEEK